LPLGIEFQRLLECLDRVWKQALRVQQVAANIVGADEIRKEEQGMLHAGARLVESLELCQRPGRQAQKVRVFRILVEMSGANGFRVFRLTGLQVPLCLLEEFIEFFFLVN
jgi:hypothetical protein